MFVIWKWTLTPDCKIEMPKGAKILTVQVQHNEPQLWAMVCTKMERETRHFKIFGTGHNIDTFPDKYIGTFQIHDGTLVFHVFEIIKEV
jgi:hypothetical protein